MECKKIFKKYYGKIAREGIIKALLCGLSVGFAADFLTAAVVWFLPVDRLWIPIGVGILAFLISAPIFYFVSFRPTAKKIAERVDSLGLEERLITMLELQNDTSYIAMRQREDAKEKLKAFDSKLLKFSVSASIAVTLAVTLLLGVGMSTVSAMSSGEDSIIPSGDQVIDDILEGDPVYVDVVYEVDGGGYIADEAEQSVLKGTDAAQVIAVADDGWMFVAWSDGLEDPTRCDRNIVEPLVVNAIFAEVDEDGDGDGDGEGGGGGDVPSDAPGGESGQSPNGNGKPSDNPGNGAGGRYENFNQIEDGEIYYRDKYDYYYQQAMDIIANGGEVPASLRQIIEAYYNIIQ